MMYLENLAQVKFCEFHFKICLIVLVKYFGGRSQRETYKKRQLGKGSTREQKGNCGKKNRVAVLRNRNS